MAQKIDHASVIILKKIKLCMWNCLYNIKAIFGTHSIIKVDFFEFDPFLAGFENTEVIYLRVKIYIFIPT